MSVDRKQRIDHYIQRLSEKNFEIYDVRRELEQKKVDEEEIKIIVRAVDAELQARLLRSTNPDYTALFIRIGVILILIGLTLGLAIVAGIINTGVFFMFAYGSFFGGISVLLFGIFKRKIGNSDHAPDQSNDEPGRRRVSFRKSSRDKS
jgi:membrane-bound ClpP family serine protease